MTPADYATTTHMANPLSSHRPLPEGRKPAVASLSSDSEESDVAVRAQLSLGSEGESGKYALCSTRPENDLYINAPFS